MDDGRVNRHDYRPSSLAHLTGDATAWITFVRFRLPAAAAGAAMLLAGLTWQFEAQRIAMLERDVAVMQQRETLAAAGAARTQRLIAIVARDRQLEERITAARRMAVASTNTIAMIGNVLPVQTWLTTVAAAPSGSWTIAGRSTRVTEIGATLRSIQQLDRDGSAHLISIATTGRAHAILDFVIGWDRQP